jgi:peptidoglycan/xylan/chitin deacetylase (PgdA/CDA1 family)
MRPQARDAVAEELGRRLGPDPPDSGLRADDVRKLVAQGFEVGFHTRRHYPLTHLTDDELAVAMTEGREALEQVIAAPLTMIAYPHGYADERVARAARAAGYRYGFTTAPVPVSPRTDPFLIGRIEPLTDNVGRFSLQLVRALLGRPYG